MRILLILVALLCAPPAWCASYFISPTGNDSNSGTSSGSPWLSPNHSVTCGDTITAATGSYSASNFTYGKWGTVTCSGGNNVAALVCATFDGCKISTSSGSAGMVIDASYWGVFGWEITTSSGASIACFFVAPPNSSTSIHHVIIANSIANGCQNGGFSAVYSGSAATDYVVYIADIAYNAAQQGPGCASGFNIVNPVAHDTVSGTHDYGNQLFSFSNVDGATCASPAPTDGEGFILDSIFTNSYTQQIVIENMIAVGNGGRCMEVLGNNSGSGAPIYIENITCWDNQTQSTQQPGGNLGEVFLYQSKNVTVTKNIAKTNQANGPQGHAYYAYLCNTCDGTDSIATNDAYSAAGNYTLAQFGSGSPIGSNLHTDPAFSNPVVPGAPSCGSSASVIACMNTVISNFAPTASGLTTYGYQIPLSYSITDPLYPAWLCNVSQLSGLVSQGCGAPPTLGSSVGGSVSVGGGTSIQ
jgi:hypothetical protein